MIPASFAAALLIARLVAAQPLDPPERPPQDPFAPVERFAEELQLTDTQKAQLREAKLQFEKQRIETRAKIEIAKLELRDLMEQPKPEEAKVKAKAQELGNLRTQMDLAHLTTLLHVKSILSAEQQEKLRHRQREHRPPEMPDRPPCFHQPPFHEPEKEDL